MRPPDLAPVLGILAGVAAVVNTIPYIRDIVRGTTRPHRGTWLIWAVLAVVVYGSQRADGASWSLIMAGAQAMLTGLVFLLGALITHRRAEDGGEGDRTGPARPRDYARAPGHRPHHLGVTRPRSSVTAG